jgi:cbb3-type cytochrome oxidase subunit 1
MALLGFVAMMIFGVAYHVIPRFTGNPLHSGRLATVHWWIANAGLAALVAGFVARAHVPSSAIPVLAAGGMLAATGAYLFIYNLWRTIDGRPAPRPATIPLARG